MHQDNEEPKETPVTRSSMVWGTYQDEIPGPEAIARQTSSGVPGTSISSSLVCRVGITCQVGHFANQSGRQSNQVARGESVGLVWVGGDVTKRRGGEYIGTCRGHHDSFGQSSAGSFFNQMDEAVFFQGPKVVVGLLA